MPEDFTPAMLAARLLRRPTASMREAIEQYEQGIITLGELEMHLYFQVQRERDLSATREQAISRK